MSPVIILDKPVAHKAQPPSSMPATVSATAPGTGRADTTPRALQAWQAGQILEARVAAVNEATGRLLLQIGELRLSAANPLPPSIQVRAGQRLQLEMISLGHPPQLRILVPQTQALQAFASLPGSLKPRQDDVGPLLQTLARVQKRLPSLDLALRRQIQRLLQTLPPGETINQPGRLKHAMANSGLFLESGLRLVAQATAQETGRAAGNTPGDLSRTRFAADFKAGLLRLATDLRQQLARFEPLPQFTTSSIPDKAAGLASSHADAGRADALLRSALTELLGAFRAQRVSLPQLAAALSRLLAPPRIESLVAALQEYHRSLRIPRELSPVIQEVIQALRLRSAPRQNAEVLLQLLRTLPVLLELQQHAESTLARVQSHQLLSLINRDATGFFLLLDLPLRFEDRLETVQLQWEGKKNPRGDDRQWEVMLDFRLPRMGRLQVRVRLRGDSLSTEFLAERRRTVNQLQARWPDLQGALAALSLQVETAHIHHGAPTQRPPSRLSEPPPEPLPEPPGRGILDETA